LQGANFTGVAQLRLATDEFIKNDNTGAPTASRRIVFFRFEARFDYSSNPEKFSDPSVRIQYFIVMESWSSSS